jgi:serine/threonine-protein kinase
VRSRFGSLLAGVTGTAGQGFEGERMSAGPRIGEQFGSFRIDGEIGRGGMGTVYQATQVGLDRTVALKILDASLSADPQFMSRFHHEATVLARLDSPQVVQVYDHGTIGGCACLAMQYVPGGDLTSLLRTRGPLPAVEALGVFADICAALADAHAIGVVHRDVKPSNVLLRRPGQTDFAYLCDFGIAQSGESNLTQAGTVAGTWAFLAPERFDGHPATARSDIYSAGCVLWAMLTGQNPYGGTDIQLALAHARAPIPMLPGNDALTQSLNQLLQGCLAKDPAMRFQDARTVSDSARRLRDSLLAPADERTRLRTPPTPVPVPPPVPAAPVYATPAPATYGATQLTDPSGRPPASRSRRWVFLLAGFLALAVVATATALVVVNWIGGSQGSQAATVRPRATRTTETAEATPGAGAPAPTAPAATAPAAGGTYQCWNGSTQPNLDACGTPTGLAAVRYLFPEAAENPECVQKFYSAVAITIECPRDLGIVRFVYWENPEDAVANFADSRYKGVTPTTLWVDGQSAGRQWRAEMDSKFGRYWASGLWVYSQFSFSVAAPNDAAREVLVSSIRLRSMHQIQGYLQSEGAQESVIG